MEDEKKNENADTQTATEKKAQNQEQKTENKNEGEKTKKQVAQKGENGEIVFKNQDELDGFIKRIYAKGAEKAEQVEKDEKGNTSNQTKEIQEEQIQQEQVVPEDYLSTKIALAMAKAGVNAERVERASRLVDASKVFVNGVIDQTKLEEEINAVVAEFPELKSTKEEEKEENGFKFGATQSEDKTNEQKKPVASKRWNRFKTI